MNQAPSHPRSVSLRSVFAALGGLLGGASGCTAAVSPERHDQSRDASTWARACFADEHNGRCAVVQAERALQLDPDNEDAHMVLGAVYGSGGDYGRAEPHFRRAVTLLEALAVDDAEKLAPLANARNSLAATMISNGHPADALPILRELSNDPHFQSPHLALGNLGLAYIGLHRCREAIAPLENAVAVRADFCVGTYRLGEALVCLNDLDRALAAFDRALSTRAEGCDRLQSAWRARGELHVRRHESEAALADFTHCRDLDANSADGRECATMLRTGSAPPATTPVTAPTVSSATTTTTTTTTTTGAAP